MSTSKNFVDLRSIGSIGGVKFKKGVDDAVKFSRAKIKKGESTLEKEIFMFNALINREKNGGKREYIELFKQIKDKLMGKNSPSPKPKSLVPLKSKEVKKLKNLKIIKA